MMVTLDQLQDGVVAYYEHEIAQKASGLGQFGAYFFMPSLSNLVKSKVSGMKGSPLVEGLMTPDGLIDLEAARDRAADAMQHCGSIDIMGFRLDRSDVDSLYDYIRRA